MIWWRFAGLFRARSIPYQSNWHYFQQESLLLNSKIVWRGNSTNGSVTDIATPLIWRCSEERTTQLLESAPSQHRQYEQNLPHKGWTTFCFKNNNSPDYVDAICRDIVESICRDTLDTIRPDNVDTIRLDNVSTIRLDNVDTIRLDSWMPFAWTS